MFLKYLNLGLLSKDNLYYSTSELLNILLIMKKIIIVHGWDGSPQEGWFPWLKTEMEKEGWNVQVPQLPNAAYPKPQEWVETLRAVVPMPDENTFFVGHSLGCQTILRYLESFPQDTSIGGAVFVAGFTALQNLDEEEKKIFEPWDQSRPDLQKISKMMKKSMAIFSDDDPWVPLEPNKEYFESIGSEIVVEHEKGHYSGNRDGCFELIIVKNCFLALIEDGAQ